MRAPEARPAAQHVKPNTPKCSWMHRRSVALPPLGPSLAPIVKAAAWKLRGTASGLGLHSLHGSGLQQVALCCLGVSLPWFQGSWRLLLLIPPAPPPPRNERTTLLISAVELECLMLSFSKLQLPFTPNSRRRSHWTNEFTKLFNGSPEPSIYAQGSRREHALNYT